MAATEDLEHRVLNLCREHKIITQDVIQNQLSVTPDLVAPCINSLIEQGRLGIIQVEGKVGFEFINEEQQRRLAELNPHERVVYDAIKHAANKGIWTRDLKLRTNIQQNQLTKVLRSLESRKLVKQVKSPTHKTRKMYMLYELEPVRDIWYTDQEYDSEFVRNLSAAVLSILDRKHHATLQDITTTLKQLGISKVELRAEHVQSIVDVLIYDGLVHSLPHPCIRDTTLYKPARRAGFSNFFTATPCAGCPVFEQCGIGGEICPESCEYITHWLSTVDHEMG